MQTQHPQNAVQKSGTDDPVRQERELSVAPTLSLWQIFHDPEAFQRTLFTRLTLVQRTKAGLIRPLRPPVEPEKTEAKGPEPAPPRDTHQSKVHQWGIVDYGSTSIHGHHSGREPLAVTHHEFSSRFRER